MAKYVLIHCYSDQNRGDAGIIEATVDLIKDIDGESEINAVSVFHEKDERFSDHHYFTSKVVNKIYPPIFPEPNIQKKSVGFGSLKKLLFFIYYLKINIILGILPFRWLAFLLLSKSQLKTFDLIKSADFVISKGGSFLYSLRGINGDFFLLRMLFAFVLPIRMKKRVCIFSQSVGPFENKFSKYFLFMVMRRLDKIYLREEKCLKFLPADVINKVSIVPDVGFYLNMSPVDLTFDGKNAAITARPHKFSNDPVRQAKKHRNYINSLVRLVSALVLQDYKVHLIGQVTGPSGHEDDRNVLRNIYDSLNNDIKERVIFWRESNKLFTPKELVNIYSSMDLTIGTRLHSSIFSMAGGTPTINIAYHGTKSQGIMESIGLEAFVMDIMLMNPEDSVDMLNDFLNQMKNLVVLVDEGVRSHRTILKKSMESFLCRQ